MKFNERSVNAPAFLIRGLGSKLENYTLLTPKVLTWGLNVYEPPEKRLLREFSKRYKIPSCTCPISPPRTEAGSELPRFWHTFGVRKQPKTRCKQRDMVDRQSAVPMSRALAPEKCRRSFCPRSK
jgi:hypothetical protein